MMMISNVLFVFFATLVCRLTLSSADMLRNQRDAPLSGTQIKIKNTSNENLHIHLRYYDGALKYSMTDNVRKNQALMVATNKKVIMALVAAETTGGKDVYNEKCLKSERDFMRYSDGLCYKLYYSMGDENISCDIGEGSQTSFGGSLRYPSSIRVPQFNIKRVQRQPRC